MPEIENYLQKLQNSPLYNLSLCSKEEFHSAFFVWFLNLDIQENIKVFFGDNAEVAEDAWAYREVSVKNASRLDIAIATKNKKVTPGNITYIIENKFKSIPDKQQLQKYNMLNNLKGKKLITFIESNLFTEGWQKTSTYRELIEKIRHAKTPKMNPNSDYINKLVQDYCNYIESLYEILKHPNLLKNEDKTLFSMLKNYEYLKTCNMLLEKIDKNLKNQFTITTSSPKGDRLYLRILHERSGYGLGIEFYHDDKKDLIFHNFVLKRRINEDEIQKIFSTDENNWLKLYDHEMKNKDQKYSSLGDVYYIKQSSKNDNDYASKFKKASSSQEKSMIIERLLIDMLNVIDK